MKFRNWLVLLFLFTSQSIYAAVSSEVSRTDYTGNGAVSSYGFTFPVKSTSELRVFVQDANGQDVELFLGSGYTCVLTSSGTGTITLTAGSLTNGYKLSIQRGIPYTQTYNPSTSGAYNPASLGVALDRLSHEVIRLKGDVDRAIKIPYLEAGGDSVTKIDDNATNRAGKGLAFDNDGNVYAGAPLSSATVSAFGQTLIDDTSADAARTTLGLPSQAMAARTVVANDTSGAANGTARSIDDITVLADGSTTRRDLSARFADIYNAKDYGAAPGASAATNTAAFQAAVNAANSAGGGTVFVPAGTYSVSAGGVEMKSNVRFVGAGKDQTLLRGPDFILGSYSSLSNVAVEDLGLECTTVTYVDAFPVYFFVNGGVSPGAAATNGVTIRNNKIIYAGSTAIMVVYATNVLIDGNLVLSSGENGIEVQAHPDASKYCTNVIIRGNTVVNWGRTMSAAGIVTFGRIEGLSVTGNIVRGDSVTNTVRAILFENANFPTETLGAIGSCVGNVVSGSNIGIQDAGCRMYIGGNTVSAYSVEGIYTDKNTNTLGNSATIGPNTIIGTASIALGQTAAVRVPAALKNTIMESQAVVPDSGENLLYNGNFLYLASASALPAPWADDAGVLGAVAPTSVAPGPAVGPQGDISIRIVAAAGGPGRFKQVMPAPELSKAQGRLVYASAWVKGSAASKARIGIRTSDGDFWSAYNTSTSWETVEVAVWVGAASGQCTVMCETVASATADWSGVCASLRYGNPGATRDSIRLFTFSANPTVGTLEGSLAVSSVAGVYKLWCYVNGTWRSVALTP